MDLRAAISEFVTRGKELCHRRLRSSERTVVTEVDLTVLWAQLFLLEHEAINLQQEVRSRKQEPDPSE